jgi:hypothetical protein
MATLLPQDFKEFLRLLNAHRVEYLVIGGYAVAHYGYPRPTADFDVWIALSPTNAERAVAAIAAFGFSQPMLTPALLLEPNRIVRMGVPPMRLEVMNKIDGVEFADCYARRLEVVLDDGTIANLIGLDDLKRNKRASNRAKDRDDLEHLE